MRRAAFVVVGASVVACGLSVVGVSSETSGVDGGLESSVAEPVVEAGPADSAIEADAAKTFCELLSPKPTFCADFDRPGVDPGWTPFPLDAGATVDLSGLNLHAVSTNKYTAALVTKKVVPTGFTLEFDVRFDRLPAAGDGKISPIFITPPEFPGHDLYFFLDENVSYFQEFDDDYSTSFVPTSLHTWHHFFLDVSTITVTTTVTAKVDDRVYWDKAILKHPITNGQTLTFQLGLACNYLTPQGADMTLDNIVLKTR